MLELYDIADGKTAPGDGDPQIVFCVDEVGPLNLLPRPGKQWAPAATKAAKGSGGGAPRRRRRRTRFLAFCRYLRSLYPPEVRIAIVMDNFSSHLSTRKDQRVGNWATANNVELAYVPRSRTR